MEIGDSKAGCHDGRESWNEADELHDFSQALAKSVARPVGSQGCEEYIPAAARDDRENCLGEAGVEEELYSLQEHSLWA